MESEPPWLQILKSLDTDIKQWVSNYNVCKCKEAIKSNIADLKMNQIKFLEMKNSNKVTESSGSGCGD